MQVSSIFKLLIIYLLQGSNELNACIWLGGETEEDTDTYLVLGGSDALVQIISIAQSKVICQLKGW